MAIHTSPEALNLVARLALMYKVISIYVNIVLHITLPPAKRAVLLTPHELKIEVMFNIPNQFLLSNLDVTRFFLHSDLILGFIFG